MGKEDYVSLQVAKLLKEKGYNEYCRVTYFYDANNLTMSSVFNRKNTELNDNCYSCPTLYEAQQWLWNVHKLLVSAFLDEPFSEPYEFLWAIQDAKNDIDNYGNKISEHGYRNYQESMNAGILEALKMI